jgi:hypothetical protein
MSRDNGADAPARQDSSDIVVRLRARSEDGFTRPIIRDEMRDAIAEIERLRAVTADMQAVIADLQAGGGL